VRRDRHDFGAGCGSCVGSCSIYNVETQHYWAASNIEMRAFASISRGPSACLSRVRVVQQEAQLSLINRPTLVQADVPCCAVMSCPLVNDSDCWPELPILPIPLPFDSLVEEIPRAIGFIFGVGKLEWLGYNSVKVAW